MTNFHDQMHIDDPSVLARTMFVDTGQVKATDFDIDEPTQDMLFTNGQNGAREFLAGGTSTATWRSSAAGTRSTSRPTSRGRRRLRRGRDRSSRADRSPGSSPAPPASASRTISRTSRCATSASRGSSASRSATRRTGCAAGWRSRRGTTSRRGGRRPTTLAPGEGPLFDYLCDRLFDSFDLPSGPARYLELMSPLLADGESIWSRMGLAAARARVADGPGRVAQGSRGHRRRPSVAARPHQGEVVGSRQLKQDHQVLAYGYDLDGGMLQAPALRPEQPGRDDVTLSLSLADPSRPTAITSWPSPGRSTRSSGSTTSRPSHRNSPRTRVRRRDSARRSCRWPALTFAHAGSSSRRLPLHSARSEEGRWRTSPGSCSRWSSTMSPKRSCTSSIGAAMPGWWRPRPTIDSCWRRSGKWSPMPSSANRRSSAAPPGR